MSQNSPEVCCNEPQSDPEPSPTGTEHSPSALLQRMYLYQHKGFVTLTIKDSFKLSRVHNVELTPRSSNRKKYTQKHMSTKASEDNYTNVNVQSCVYYPTGRG